MIYYINLILLLAEVCLFKSYATKVENDKHIDNIFLIITFLQHSLIYSLRKIPVGKDLSIYADIFNSYKRGWDYDYLEPGFRLLNKICSLTGMNDQFFVAFVGSITIFLYFRFIKKNSDDVYFSVVIFSFFMTYCFIFNGLRQALAMAVILQSVKPLLERKYKSFFIIALIAISFHYSAALFLIIFIFRFISFKPGISTFFATVILGILMGLIVRPLLNVTHYSGYLNSGFDTNGSILNPLLYVALFLVISLLFNQEEDYKDHFFYSMFGLATIVYLVSLQLHIVNRMAYYFTPSAMIIIPSLCRAQISKRNRIIMYLSFYALFIVYGISLIILNGNDILPYEFIWK